MRGTFLSEEVIERIASNRSDPEMNFIMDGPASEVHQRIEQLQMVGVNIRVVNIFEPGTLRLVKDGVLHTLTFKLDTSTHLPTKKEFK